MGTDPPGGEKYRKIGKNQLTGAQRHARKSETKKGINPPIPRKIGIFKYSLNHGIYPDFSVGIFYTHFSNK